MDPASCNYSNSNILPRPERARGTVKDGVYRRHPPAGDGEHLDRPPNQRNGGHLAAGRRKARSQHKRLQTRSTGQAETRIDCRSLRLTETQAHPCPVCDH
ncbi:unnamed protein product [Arctogadus glacialis]